MGEGVGGEGGEGGEEGELVGWSGAGVMVWVVVWMHLSILLRS